ncbi:MAG: hypothetical protein AB7G21_00925 [Dehalococcoidia bacterium]
MKHLVPLVLAAALLAGCTEPRAVVATATAKASAAGTGTAGSTPSPTPSPAPTPVASWSVPPRTGVAHLDAIISAMVAGDRAALEPYVAGDWGVCGRPGDHPLCLPGAAEDAPVLVVRTAACPGAEDWARLVASPETAPPGYMIPMTRSDFATRAVRGPASLRAVYQRTTPTNDYRLVFVSQPLMEGVDLFVGEQGIYGYRAWFAPYCPIVGRQEAGEALLVPPPQSP